MNICGNKTKEKWIMEVAGLEVWVVLHCWSAQLYDALRRWVNSAMLESEEWVGWMWKLVQAEITQLKGTVTVAIREKNSRIMLDKLNDWAFCSMWKYSSATVAEF